MSAPTPPFTLTRPTCEICHEDAEPAVLVVNNGARWLICEDCADQLAHYAAMTPEERRADDAAQAAYVELTKGLGL